MSGIIPPLPNTPSWRGAQLKHSDNFAFIYRGMEVTSIYKQKKITIVVNNKGYLDIVR
jgi:hypothetical protein